MKTPTMPFSWRKVPADKPAGASNKPVKSSAPSKVGAAASGSSSALASVRVSRSELLLFTTQLAVMLDSGVVLTDAIEAVCQQMPPTPFRAILADVATKIRNGESMSAALSAYPKAFDPMFISMVKASEATGKMGAMLTVLADYQTADAQTYKQVKSALIYPIMMLLMAVAATGSLMFFVLPRFTKIYESRGAALPTLTRWLVSASSMLADPQFMAAACTVGALGYLAFSSWRKTLSGQKTLDWLQIRLPIVGPIFVTAVLTRCMRILSTMVNTGVNLMEALTVMQSACPNYYFRSLWLYVIAKVRDGCQFSDALKNAPYGGLVPPAMLQMMRAGEKSGKLGFACERISMYLERQLQNTIRTATTLIEPLMIMIMGGIIGTIAIALLLPVFRISSVVAH